MESELAIMGPKQPFWIQEKLKVQHMQIHTKNRQSPMKSLKCRIFPAQVDS